MSSLLPPADKLPLAARKSIRDNFEAKKSQHEQQLSNLLGTPWKVDINFNAIWPYAKEGTYSHNNPGASINEYVSNGLLWHLQDFVKKHKDSGVAELNSLANTHTVTLIASEKPTYAGVEIADGQLRLLFNPQYLGTNVSQAATPEALVKAIGEAGEAAGGPGLSYAAKHSIETNYEPKIGAVLSESQKLLQLPSLKFEPNFDANAAKLAAGGARSDWEKNLGSFTLQYFEAFLFALKQNKFGEDELLRDGFAEAVPKAAVSLRVVDALKKGSGYNEILIEDGEVFLQTTPKAWSTNTNQTALSVVDLL